MHTERDQQDTEQNRQEVESLLDTAGRGEGIPEEAAGGRVEPQPEIEEAEREQAERGTR